MRTVIAMLLAVTCAASFGFDGEIPGVVYVHPQEPKGPFKDPVKREKWLMEVRDRYWNDEWLLDAVDRYAKTGVKPKIKLPIGMRVEFGEHQDRQVLARHLIGAAGLHGQGSIRKTRRGYVGGTFWLDDNVVPWSEIDIPGKMWDTSDGRRMESR